MDWLKKNPEKAVLILVALVALGFGVKHLLAVQSYAQRFELPATAKKGKAIPETPEALVEKSAALVELPLFWTDKSISIPGSTATKEVPLLRSVYIVEKDGKLFDLANPNTESLRPPVPNQWILERNLEILHPKILEMDADSDGFSNLEEFQAKSEPTKKESHPPYTDKLYFASRPKVDLNLKFAAANAPDFQITLLNGAKSIGTAFYREGQKFPDSKNPLLHQKFTLMKYTEKKDPKGMDASELEVKDNTTQKLVTLVLRNVTSCPIYAVDLDFPLGTTAEDQKIRVQEGNTFRLSLEPETEYTLVSAGSDSATIRRTGSTEDIIIRKR